MPRTPLSPSPGRLLRGGTGRLVTALGAGALTLSTVACGADATTPAASTGSSTSTATTTSAGATSAGSTSQQSTSADSLVIYSGRNKALVDPLLQEFEKTTGTKVSVRYADSATLAAQLGEEGERTTADVFFSQDAGALGALSKAGRLDPLPAGVLDRVPARYRAANGTWVGTSGRVRVLAYNPGQVPAAELPASVLDLTGPKWRDKVGYAPTNASFQAFVTGMRLLRGDEVTLRWLEQLKANGAQAYDGNINVLDAVDRGEVAVGLLNHYYWYERVAERGADKVTARLHYLRGGDPGGLVNVAGVGVLAGSDQREAAGRLVDFLLSPRAQQYFADETEEYPLTSAARPDPQLPALDSLGAPDVDLSRLEDLQATQALMERAGVI